MLRLAWKNVLLRTSRLLLSAIAVALGVGFVGGTLVVTDTTRQALLDQLSRTPLGVSVVVERDASAAAGGAKTVPAALLDQVRQVPGVVAAAGQLWGTVNVFDQDGQRLVTGKRAFLLGIADDPALLDVTVVDGAAPTGRGEIALDIETAQARRVAIGGQLRMPAAGGSPALYTVTGLIDVGARRADFGDAVVVALPAEAAGTVLGATAYGRIDVRGEPGLGDRALADRIAAAVGAPYAVRTGDEVRGREASESSDDLDSFRSMLLVFAGISLVVSGFVVFNTFSILIGQRLRETALLRCMGASRRQVFASALGESAVLGLLASLLGLLFGVGMAYLLLAVFGGPGDSLDARDTPLQFSARTAVLGVLVGVVVCVLSALVPIARAARTPPLAVLREQHAQLSTSGRRRRTVALVLGGLAVVLAVVGVAAARAAAGAVGPVAAAAGVLLGAVAVLAAGPLFVPRLGVAAGRLMGRLAGYPARLAGENVRRNPGRTAATAAALTIGLTLVTLVSTLTAATAASIEGSFAKSYPFAYSLSAGGAGGIPGGVLTGLRSAPEVASVVGVRGPSLDTEITVAGRTIRARGVDDTVSAAAPDATSSGSLQRFGPGSLAVDRELADQLGLAVGDRTSARARGSGAELPLTVVALLDETSPLGPFAISGTDLARVAPDAPVTTVLVKATPAAGDGALRRRVETVTAAHPAVSVVSAEQNVQQWSEAVDTLRGLLLSLLGLSILIGFFSLANTLSLSMMERTRESALLRALGLTRGQLRRMLAVEGVIVSVVGAGAGIVLGLLAGWILSAAMGWSPAAVFALPITQIILFGLGALVIGVAATVLPARRALTTPIAASLSEE